MQKNSAVFSIIAILALLAAAVAQDSATRGFIIKMKNGSTIVGQSLTRDEASGNLRLTMTESGSSYAVIAMDDVDVIQASGSGTDSIQIKLRGGSELKCKEFTIGKNTVILKIGTASRIEVQWADMESVRFQP